MGKQSRQRAERRQARQVRGSPTRLLGELLSLIQNKSHQTARRAWEMMLELLAHHTGINALASEGCLSAETRKLVPDLGDLAPLLLDYVSSWQAELQLAAKTGSPITDPIGTVLDEAGATNAAMGQFFTPPSVVRMMNKLTLEQGPPPERKERVLDPCCGTGRFALDALVHRPSVVLYNVDLDLWMMRAALINFRLAPRFTTANLTIPGDDGRPQHVIVPGGKSWIIRADSFLIDLNCVDNWRFSWMWNPPPWQSVMKLADFDGTYDELQRRKPGRKLAELEARKDKQRADQLLDIQLDEAKLHAEMVRASKDIAVPTIPLERTAPLFDDINFGTTSALPFGDRDALPLLSGRARGR